MFKNISYSENKEKVLNEKLISIDKRKKRCSKK
jgi:hypothetical protein